MVAGSRLPFTASTCAHRNYSAFARELQALYLTVRHFRYFLEGRPFMVFADHKPIIFAFTKVFLLTSLPTVVLNSPLPCGRPWLSCTVLSCITRLRTILRLTVWLSGFTAI